MERLAANDRLAGKRILVVEDEYFIASDLARALDKAGAVAVGPVGDVRGGMALLDSGVDAAILDVNLIGARSYSLADALAARHVPFLFVTGYDDWALPDAYRAVPRLAKPFQVGAVIDRIEQLVAEEMVAT